MQSDRRQTSNSYLLSVLADGAKPFRYRSGVRSLLGIPGEEGNNLAFSPTLPPVGFRYANQAFGSESYITPYPLHMVDRFTLSGEQGIELVDSPETPLENIQHGVTAEETSIGVLNSFEKSQDTIKDVEGRQHKVLINDIARHSRVGPEPKQDKVSAELTEESEKPGVIIERAGIEIPGVSDKYSSFSVSTPAKKGDTSSGKTESRVQREVPPTEDQARHKLLIKEVARHSGAGLELKQEKVSTELVEKSGKPAAIIERASLEIPGTSEKNKSFPGLFPAKKGDTPSGKTESRVQGEVPLTEDQAQHKLLIKEAARHSRVGPEPKQDKVLAELTEESGKPGVIIERAGIEIPGVSDKYSSFSVSTPAKKGDTSSGKTENRAQQEVFSADSNRNFLRKCLSESQESVPIINSMSTSIYAPERPQRAENVKERFGVTPSPGKLENPVAKKCEFLSRMVSLPVVSEEKRTIKSEQTSGTFPFQYVAPHTVHGSNQNAADRIEQLRQAVQQLTSKVALQPAGTNHEPKQQQPQQTPLPPVQPVVIVKRSSSRAKTSCAFWERSYLGRFHLRPLR